MDETNLVQILNEFRITKTKIEKYISKNSDLISQKESRINCYYLKSRHFEFEKKIKNEKFSIFKR